MHKALDSNPSAQEMKAGGSEVEGHHRLYSDFRVGYMKLSQKQKDHGAGHIWSRPESPLTG